MQSLIIHILLDSTACEIQILQSCDLEIIFNHLIGVCNLILQTNLYDHFKLLKEFSKIKKNVIPDSRNGFKMKLMKLKY